MHVIVEDFTLEAVAAVEELLAHPDPLFLLLGAQDPQKGVEKPLAAWSQTVESVRFHNVSHEGKRVVLALLQLVGRNFRSVSFHDIGTTEPLDDWLHGVFVACPRLEKLHIHGGHFRSLDTIAEAFKRDLAMLIACGPAWNAKGVCRLVLDSNFRLQLFDFHVNYRIETREQRWYWSRLGVIERRETPVHAVKMPSALKAKIAFLSAVTGSSREPPTAMQTLDTSVLSLVFQFAAECHTRRVEVLFDDPIHDSDDDEEDEEDEDDNEAEDIKGDEEEGHDDD